MPKKYTRFNHFDEDKTLLEVAIQLATHYHRGQVDKAGDPYILHPLRVMFAVEPQGELAQIVAVLHDVLEDTDCPPAILASVFPQFVLDALDAITHAPNEPREEYYARVKSNALATIVKRADIDDNSNPVRMRRLDEKTQLRLRRKYQLAKLYIA